MFVSVYVCMKYVCVRVIKWFFLICYTAFNYVVLGHFCPLSEMQWIRRAFISTRKWVAVYFAPVALLTS